MYAIESETTFETISICMQFSQDKIILSFSRGVFIIFAQPRK